MHRLFYSLPDFSPSRRLQAEYPGHPLVLDLKSKSDAFDTALSQFTVPAPA